MFRDRKHTHFAAGLHVFVVRPPISEYFIRYCALLSTKMLHLIFRDGKFYEIKILV